MKSGGGTVRGHESCRGGNLHGEKSRKWKTEKVMSGMEKRKVIDLLCLMVGRRLVVEVVVGELIGRGKHESGLIYEGKDPNCDEFRGNVKWRQVTSALS